MSTKPKSVIGKTLNEISASLRYRVIQMCHDSKSAHLGSSLSCIDILSSLYFQILNLRFLTGRNVTFYFVQRVMLLWRYMQHLRLRGFFLLSCWNNIIKTVVCLQNIPLRQGLAGVEAATGSLGHGLPIATGEALAIKMRQQKRRVFCLISDGETNEGSVWEAALFAAAHKLII